MDAACKHSFLGAPLWDCGWNDRRNIISLTHDSNNRFSSQDDSGVASYRVSSEAPPSPVFAPAPQVCAPAPPEFFFGVKWYTVSPNVIFWGSNAPNLISAGAPPQTPLGELTVLDLRRPTSKEEEEGRTGKGKGEEDGIGEGCPS